MPSEQYQAGGLTLDNDNGSQIGGLFDVIGRGWNNLSGTTAANMFNAQEAEKERQFNSTEAQKARDFEYMMSSTAYQRAAADMKKAGINPATLSGLQSSGSAASTGSGNAASSSHASGKPSNAGSVVGSLIKAAVSIALMA